MIVVIGLFGKRDKCCDLRVNSFTPKLEVPIDESAVVIVYLGVFYNYGPITNSRFSPKI